MLAEQVLALIIFISMFVLIVLDKIERHYVTLGCGALTLIGVFGIIMKSPEAVISTLNLRSIFTSGFWYQSAAAARPGRSCPRSWFRWLARRRSWPMSSPSSTRPRRRSSRKPAPTWNTRSAR